MFYSENFIFVEEERNYVEAVREKAQYLSAEL